ADIRTCRLLGARLSPPVSLTWIAARGRERETGDAATTARTRLARTRLARTRLARTRFGRADGVCRAQRPCPRAGRIRSAGRRFFQLFASLRRSRPMRGALRARRALPRLGVFLPRDREQQRGMLAQIEGDAARGVAVLRLGGARYRCHRTAQRINRVRDRPLWRRLPSVRRGARSEREGVPADVRGRGRMPRLDVRAARLSRAVGGLLSQEPHHPPGAQTMLYFWSRALTGGSASNSFI